MKLVATDIDGTILPHSTGVVSARTVAALRACREAGVRVVFVTGRPPRWIPPITEATGHDGWTICANGAVVWDAARGEVVDKQVISHEAARAVEQAFRDAVGAKLARKIGFAIETVNGFRHEEAYQRDRPGSEHSGARVGGAFIELLDGDPAIIKLLVSSQVFDSDDLLAIARETVAGFVTPSHSTPGSGLLELGPLGVNKATALAGLAQGWGIDPSEVVSFGDMPNDVEMLGWAGLSWAMGDGHPEAKKAAKKLASSAEADGVAEVIERLLAEM